MLRLWCVYVASMSCLCYIYVTSTLRLWGRNPTKESPRARLVGWILKPQMTCHGNHLTYHLWPMTLTLDVYKTATMFDAQVSSLWFSCNADELGIQNLAVKLLFNEYQLLAFSAQWHCGRTRNHPILWKRFPWATVLPTLFKGSLPYRRIK